MKRTLIALSLIALATIPFGVAQTPDTNQEQKLLAIIKEVQTQQAQMAENEKKIEQKLTDLSDIIHDARIFTKRAR